MAFFFAFLFLRATISSVAQTPKRSSLRNNWHIQKQFQVSVIVQGNARIERLTMMR